MRNRDRLERNEGFRQISSELSSSSSQLENCRSYSRGKKNPRSNTCTTVLLILYQSMSSKMRNLSFAKNAVKRKENIHIKMYTISHNKLTIYFNKNVYFVTGEMTGYGWIRYRWRIGTVVNTRWNIPTFVIFIYMLWSFVKHPRH